MAFHLFRRTSLLLQLAIIMTFSACKKETEIQIKEVEKTYSWKEDRHSYGLSKVILGLGQDASSLYLQSPGMLNQILPGAKVSAKPYFQNLNIRLPSDVQIRVPLATTIFAFPWTDTVVTVAPYANAVNPEYSADISLHKLDPQALTYSVSLSDYSLAAINRNNYLLLGYRRAPTTAGAPVLRLVLAHATFSAFQRVQVQSQTIDFPVPPIYGAPSITHITAIDNYFLVSQSGGGLYKVTENGAIRLVSTENSVTATYKWQGNVYAQLLNSSLLVSADAGETWTSYANVPSYLRTSGFRVLGDSLVGYIRASNQLYSLRWNGNKGRVRELKNDGLGETAITDIALLGDTVYVSTTSGLFKRPKAAFFDSKPTQ